MIAIASTRAAIGPNSGTITVPTMSIVLSPALNGMLSVLVVAALTSLAGVTALPPIVTMKLVSGNGPVWCRYSFC